MAFYQNERVALFIDGANLYSAAKTVGVEIDYRKLLEEFRKRGRLIRAYYYTALVENDDYSPIRPLVDWLQYNGFNVITKSAREFTDRDGRRRVKGDMDVEITVDMMNLANHLDHIVLFSGDGDLTRVVQAVKDKGVRVSVVSTVKTQPAMISDDLRRAADTFIDLTDLAKLIGRPPRDDEQSSDYGDEEDDD
ncbi:MULTISPECIES: NYN domain-containing protein [Ponticaulis]|uniref:LabA-like NYN domain-containing protein n=1 Tax=Ponticaulis TaxID=1123044 RepID=UPI0003B48F95|nr:MULTISPECIES: NYN domain-containing protein [Ponticaulis]MBN04406.1 NYN domain-containing protein [Ponticaulis sp.]